MERLPEELLLRIVEYSQDLNPPHRNRRYTNLRHLMLVNKRFARIVEPVLYSTCNLEWPCQNDESKTLKRIQDLTRTLVTKPYLTHMVKHLMIKYYPSLTLLEHNQSSIPADELAILEATALPLQKFTQSSQLGVEFRRDTQDTRTALLLSLLLNLESLRMEMVFPDVDFRDLSDEVVTANNLLYFHLASIALDSAVSDNQALFTRLSTVYLDGDCCPNDYLDYWDFSLTSVFLALPSLRAFTGCGAVDSLGMKSWRCPAKGSNVKEIKLIDCSVGNAGLQVLLRSCRALNALKFVQDYEYIHLKHGPEFTYASIQPQLLEHSSSLTRLCLTKRDLHSPDWHDETVLGSLATLDKLKCLHIEEDALYNTAADYDICPLSKILPQSLEHLVYGNSRLCDANDLIRHLGQFARMRDYLHTLEIHWTSARSTDKAALEFPDLSFEELSWFRLIVRKKLLNDRIPTLKETQYNNCGHLLG